jgi:hypothetical protein
MCADRAQRRLDKAIGPLPRGRQWVEPSVAH